MSQGRLIIPHVDTDIYTRRSNGIPYGAVRLTSLFDTACFIVTVS